MKTSGVRIAVCFFQICLAAVAWGQSPAPSPRAQSVAEKITSDYNTVRSLAIKGINQKYIPLAEAEMKLTLKEGNLQKANAINEWSKRLADTDDKSNTGGIATVAAPGDRLAILQATYLKERNVAVMMVDKSYATTVEEEKQKAMQEGDLDGANAADKLLARIKTDLNGAAQESAATKPFGVRDATSANPGITPPPVTQAPTPGTPTTSGSTPVPASGFVPGVGFSSSSNASNASPFSGTVWTSVTHIGGSNGATATLTFKADGTWIEDYAPNPLKGRWKATKEKNVVEVTLARGGKIGGEPVVHFTISEDGKSCTRKESSVGYALVKKE